MSEDYVPIVVIQTLAQHVVTGIQELYKEIVDGVQPIKLVRRFQWTPEIKREWEKVFREVEEEESD